jgi:hypothetical protein
MSGQSIETKRIRSERAQEKTVDAVSWRGPPLNGESYVLGGHCGAIRRNLGVLVHFVPKTEQDGGLACYAASEKTIAHPDRTPNQALQDTIPL